MKWPRHPAAHSILLHAEVKNTFRSFTYFSLPFVFAVYCLTEQRGNFAFLLCIQLSPASWVLLVPIHKPKASRPSCSVIRLRVMLSLRPQLRAIALPLFATSNPSLVGRYVMTYHAFHMNTVFRNCSSVMCYMHKIKYLQQSKECLMRNVRYFFCGIYKDRTKVASAYTLLIIKPRSMSRCDNILLCQNIPSR